ncbi:alpha-L-arabinofuranosidase C-terminal domain-containing protein [Actinoplanes sp. NBRC 101535]|uniref:alpha-L-arabinofuranosidase C-terminal domain-containing protein n=1 Tax=Actinoplanes sp. NBRC 101535 TaxID=3032196 RepID=UPI002557A731|nr:alpha-L-arabinofuranosidase C-terminal domain-containing protein [Actinoplanes sp. NBRC 101535]
MHIGDAVTETAPDLWGLFLEDLNDAFDGGLNAEQVRNGDFEFTPSHLSGWSFTGTATIRTDLPIHAANPHFVRVTGPAVLVNEGWDGLHGSRLRFTCFARTLTGPSLIHVAGVPVTIDSPGWQQNSADLSLDTRGPLRIEVPSGSVVDLDCVSVRPTGPGGEPLTFRPDLLQALQDLSPSFIRFPGGCLAHGFGLDNIYHWKQTIGARHGRAQAPNIWGYHQSRQLGYLEFFQLCEATGATAVPVVAAGVCCPNSPGGAEAIPVGDMDDYVQDVLDLIEFANGAATTPWGARRSELGHPAPFGLRYLGVGNEDQITDDFRDRYARIEDAVREHHPEITVIGTSGPQTHGPDYEAGWEYARKRGIAMVDEHGYQSPRWLHQNVDRYAGYDPAGPKVYLGEWAGSTSRVRSALAEAAYMIGLERSPGVVRMASYAPLLARAGHTQWTPDLIYFTADEVRPSASYYVQQAFAAERGRHVHPVTLDGVPDRPDTSPRTGTARLSVRGESIVAFTGRLPPLIDTVDADLEFTAVAQRGTDGFELRLGPDAPHRFLRIVFRDDATVIIRSDDGIDNVDQGPLPWAGPRIGERVHVRVRLDGPRVRVWVDGELRHDHLQDMRPEQRIVAGAVSRPGPGGRPQYIVRLVNALPDARTARLILPGVPGPFAADVTVLAGAGPDQGAFHQASPVTPVRTTVTGTDLHLPPWSLTTAVVTPL